MRWLAKKNVDGTLSDIANRDVVIWTDGSVDIEVKGPPSSSLGFATLKLDENGDYVDASTVDDDLKKLFFNSKVLIAIVRCLVTLPPAFTNNFPTDAKAILVAANSRVNQILKNRVPSGKE